MGKFKKWLIPVAIVCLLLATLVGCSSAPASLGETFDPSGNPFANRFSDEKDIRTATFVVAASDSEHKYEADYFCNGTNDHVQVQAALDALPATGGEIALLDGTYTFGAQVARAIDDVTFMGSGAATLINWNGVNPVITAGAQDSWLFYYFGTDAGGVSIAAATNSAIRSVFIAGIRTDDPAAVSIVSVTLVVAATDSLDPTRADYQCDGTAATGGDQVEINTAIEAMIKSVTDEVFNSGALDVWVTLDNNRIQRGEVVTSDGITYTNGVDYNMDYSAGMIMCLSTGGMAAATNFYNDYEYGGGDVKLLDGTFWITTSVLVRSHVGLIGSAGTIIKQQVSITSIDMIRNYDWVDGNDYITFCDLRIDGNKLTQIGGTGRCLILYLVDNFEIRNCYFEQSRNQGLNLSTCNYGTALDCGAHRNDDYGLYISQGSHIILDNNICLDNAENGIYVTAAQYFTVTNNHSQRSGWNGIYILNSDHGIVSDNLSIENSQSSDNAYSNIKLSNSDYNLVSGNICRQGALTNKPKYGLDIDSSCIKNVVQGNDLYDSGGTANFIDAGVCTIVRDDNRDIASIQVKHLVYVQNTSGGNLLIGNIVSYEAAAGTIGFQNPTAIGDPQAWGMLVENITDTSYGYIQVLGGTTVMDATNVGGGAIVIGDLLTTEVGSRARKAAAGHTAFAIALEDGDAADMVIDALIITPRQM